MKNKKLEFLILALVLSASVFNISSAEVSSGKIKTEQELFLAGADAISKGKYEESRILLKTFILTYTESPLKDQARILLFYSYAREGGPNNEKAAKLLEEIEEQMKGYEPKNRIQ